MDNLEIDAGHVIPAAELELRVARSSGPGGQGVNTTDSAVELRWDVAGTVVLSDAERRRVTRKLANRITNDGVLIVRASDHRSQHRNREEARARLRKLVAGALQRRKERRTTKPSRAAKRRRVEEKRRRGEVKRLRQPPDA